MRSLVLALVGGGALAGCGGASEPMGLMATIQTADGQRVEFAGAAQVMTGDVLSIVAADPVTGWRMTVEVPPAAGDYALGRERGRSSVLATWNGTDAAATRGSVTVLSAGTHGEMITGTLTDVHLVAGEREVCVISAGTFSARVP